MRGKFFIRTSQLRGPNNGTERHSLFFQDLTVYFQTIDYVAIGILQGDLCSRDSVLGKRGGVTSTMGRRHEDDTNRGIKDCTQTDILSAMLALKRSDQSLQPEFSMLFTRTEE